MYIINHIKLEIFALTYIKINTDFISIVKLAELISAPIDEIENCVNKGLLHEDEVEDIGEFDITIRKIREYIKQMQEPTS